MARKASAPARLARRHGLWYNGPMRQQIEQLVRATEAARQTHRDTDAATNPVAWARSDQAVMEATGRLAHAVHDAVRRLGLPRELGRALAGTGFGIGRLAFDATDLQLHAELDGGPESPTERRRAADPAVADRIHAIRDEFYSSTGVEIAFPYDQLTGA